MLKKIRSLIDAKNARKAAALAAAAKQKALRESDEAYVYLNNLYLALERGKCVMTIHTHNRLRELLDLAYPLEDCDTFTESLRSHWLREFEKLPHYYDV